MKFYYFNGGNHIANGKIRKLEKSGFTGVLFTYEAISRDYFTQIARDIRQDEKIKYMVAIRPYAISPQYLTMISTGMNEIMPNRLQINLISGHIKDNEFNFGGIVGDVNDQSSNIKRSNYLIEYLKEIDKIKSKVTIENYPDFFVTTTNPYVFKTAKELNQKMIIPYPEFKSGHWKEYEDYNSSNKKWLGEKINLENTDIMIALSPVLRDTKEELKKASEKMKSRNTAYFTTKEFTMFIQSLKEKNINKIMLRPRLIEEEENRVINFVKNFK